MLDHSRKTILLVEDEALIALAEKQQLESGGYQVKIVTSGLRAVDLVNESPGTIDLILMDINLGPGMDGIETATRILEHHDLPIVFVSAQSEKIIIERTERLTSYGYILKNTGETVLLTSVKMAFKLHDANARLRESESRYRRLVENSPDVVYTFSSKRGGIYYSPSVEHLLGYPIQSLYAHPLLWNESIHSVDMPKVAQVIEDFAKGIPFDIEYRIRDANGDWRWLRDRSIGRYIIGDDVMIEGLVTDITERKEMQDAVSDSLDKVRTLFEIFPLGIFATDSTGKIIQANRYATELLTHDQVEFKNLSDPFWRVIHPDHSPMQSHERPTERALTEKCVVGPIELGLERTNYPIIWLEVTAAPYIDGGVVVTLKEISEPKRTEGMFRQSKDDAKTLVAAAPDAIFLADPETRRIIDANKSACRLLQRKKEEIIGLLQSELHPPQRFLYSEQTFNSHVEESQREGFTHPIETTVIRKDGVQVPVEVVAQVMRLGGRKVLMGIFRDITQRKADEAKIKDLLNEKELMLQEVHHRVKNNLNTIISLLQLQMSLHTESTVRSALQDTSGRIQSMMTLYDKLNSSENFQTVFLKEYLTSLVEGVIRLFPLNGRISLQADIEDIALTAKQLSPLGIILNELTTNAMKYAFQPDLDGQIFIQASRINNYIRLVFRDTGRGLPDGFSIQNAKGFGLHLVDLLVGQLGGQLMCENHGGAQFTIEFLGDQG